jgi:hypothetical protein
MGMIRSGFLRCRSAMEIGHEETVRVFVVNHVDSSDFEREPGIEFAVLRGGATAVEGTLSLRPDRAVAALVDVTRYPGVRLQFPVR